MADLHDALVNIDPDTCSTLRTFSKLSEEDQRILRGYFQEWANLHSEIPLDEHDKNSLLIALGFIIGHNFVKTYWTIW